VDFQTKIIQAKQFRTGALCDLTKRACKYKKQSLVIVEIASSKFIHRITL